MFKQRGNPCFLNSCAAVGVGAMLLIGSGARAQVTPFTAVGPNAAGIQTTVDNFRNALGANNGVGGTFASGRREINWDAVPAIRSDPNQLPANFFNANSPRGVEFSTPTNQGFLVSAASGGSTPTAFGFSGDFVPFSNEKLFTAINSTITDIHFFLPGTSTQATVLGFGAVFSDVEISNATKIEYFDTNDSLITSIFADSGANQGFSFVGATSTIPIFHVRITAGINTILANGILDNPNDDVVVMDDFIYAEPVALVSATAPEPGSLALLLGSGLTFAGAIVRRRRS